MVFHYLKDLVFTILGYLSLLFVGFNIPFLGLILCSLMFYLEYKVYKNNKNRVRLVLLIFLFIALLINIIYNLLYIIGWSIIIYSKYTGI